MIARTIGRLIAAYALYRAVRERGAPRRPTFPCHVRVTYTIRGGCREPIEGRL